MSFKTSTSQLTPDLDATLHLYPGVVNILSVMKTEIRQFSLPRSTTGFDGATR